MSFEHALITRVCDAGEWRTVRDIVTPDHFTQVDCQTVWRFIIKHGITHGSAPSRDIIRDQFPAFTFEASSDPPTALADRLHSAHIYNTIAVNTEKIMKAAMPDPIGAAELAASFGSQMRTMLNRSTGNIGVDVTKQMAEEREAYRIRAEHRGLTGWEWPWPALNRKTMGAEPGSLYVLYARPKTGKTFYLIYLLAYWWYKYKARIHLFGREMRTEQLRSRFTATVANVDYDRYQRGQLTDAEYSRWWEATEVIEESHSFYIDGVTTNGEEAADEMFDKAADTGAECIGVDGAYFFGERDWEIFAKFSSRFKTNLLHRYRAVGAMTTQGARQKKAGGDDVAYGDSMLQDADILLKLQTDPDDRHRTHFSTAGVRDGMPAKWQAWRRPCIDFGQAFEEPDEVSGPGGGDGPAPDVTA